MLTDRYSHTEMAHIWSEQRKFETWLAVEIAAAEVLAEDGTVPAAAVEEIKAKASFSIDRIDEIERQVKHDVVAFIQAVAENVGEAGRYIHFGLTSYDVVDTALGLLLREAAGLILADIDALSRVLERRAFEHQHTVMVGRTHGMHAEPMTFGLKLALWYAEIERSRERVVRAREQVSVGKLSGAVGTFAHLPPSIEERVCKKLGLSAAPISSQILQRDRHGEQVSGLARVVRSNVQAGFENIPLWNERDISHSSVERMILPSSFILTDHILRRMTDILENLSVYPEQMRKNLDSMKGLVFSGHVLLALANTGLSREEAYRIVQRNAMAVWEEKGEFKSLLTEDPDVQSRLSPAEVETAFDLRRQLRHVDVIFERVFRSKR